MDEAVNSNIPLAPTFYMKSNSLNIYILRIILYIYIYIYIYIYKDDIYNICGSVWQFPYFTYSLYTATLSLYI